MFNKTLLFFFLYANISFAQLTINNNNYVFAQDVVFFVTDDVRLTDANSYLYLRGESQLIQGTGTTGNSGIGKLSVYQNGTVNAYAYNFWCSPVGNTDSDNTANRNFRANNIMYDVTSAPISSSLATYTSSYNGSSSPLIIASCWLWSYNPGTIYDDWDFVGDTGNVSAGYGFSMKGNSTENQLYDFRGKPNNGTITTNVTNGEETLVGNPYPSALDARDYIHDATNSSLLDSGTLMFWEQAPGANSHFIANYVGGYATYTISSDGSTETFVKATFDTYNEDGTINTTGASSSTSKQVRRYIPIGQGFMIRGNATGSARTTNSMRAFEKESGSSSEFFRPFSTDNSSSNQNRSSYTEDELFIVSEDYMRFRLNIDFNETYTRQLLQNFHHTATDGEDYGLETISPNVRNSDAYWPYNQKEYNAQAFDFNADLTIPLVVKIEENQPLRFRIFDVQNFDESQPIFLHDIQNDLYVDLRSQNYDINIEAGNYTNRFEITFKEHLLSNTKFDTKKIRILQNNNNSELVILNPERLDIRNVRIVDVSGKVVLSKVGFSSDRFSYSTKNLSDAVYIVNLTLNNQEVKGKKIIVKN